MYKRCYGSECVNSTRYHLEIEMYLCYVMLYYDILCYVSSNERNKWHALRARFALF